MVRRELVIDVEADMRSAVSNCLAGGACGACAHRAATKEASRGSVCVLCAKIPAYTWGPPLLCSACWWL